MKDPTNTKHAKKERSKATKASMKQKVASSLSDVMKKTKANGAGAEKTGG